MERAGAERLLEHIFLRLFERASPAVPRRIPVIQQELARLFVAQSLHERLIDNGLQGGDHAVLLHHVFRLERLAGHADHVPPGALAAAVQDVGQERSPCSLVVAFAL